ncbi:MAG: precorrin-4 C(11)-methyltransferase [Nodosilinea sp.]
MVSALRPASDHNSSRQPLAPGVYIVGAGPGDPELLTVKAQRLLSQADTVLYANSLVPRQILEWVRADADRIGTANLTLDEILPLRIERVRAGQAVVRLQSGDPSLYSAIHEQMQALAAAAIPFEVIPGISAYQAAAARLKTELTIPGLVQSIILTRISGRTRVPDGEDLAALAAHQTSICLYLSARHVETAQAQLMAHYPPQTPVAVCYRLGWPDEQIWRISLEEMAAVTHRYNLTRTTLYLVSPALGTSPDALASADTSNQAEDRLPRSRLYNPDHNHLFRPQTTPPAPV